MLAQLGKTPSSTRRPVEFRPYTEGASLCPVLQVTPEDGYYIHRFYDVSPWSPSGRYLAVLRIPFQDREPEADDAAEVCVIDLHERTIESVHSTTAWGTQMGAQQQWGRTDRFLYFNDKRGGEPVCVRLDLETRETFYTEGSLYPVSPDGRFAVGPNLYDINLTQPGYGAAPPPERRPVLRPGSDGRCLWRTDLESGRRECLVTYSEIRRHVPESEALRQCGFYGFHVKFNPQNDRILFVLRAVHPGKSHRRLRMLFSFRTDGSDIRLAVPEAVWSRGGHHPNWHPDGRRGIMNLKLDGERMRFVEFRHDGGGLRELFEDIPGSGHPSYSADGRFIVTDAYPGDQGIARSDGAVPLRLIGVETASCREAAWMPVLGAGRKELRCDLHPAWNRDSTQVCLDGAPRGAKQVFIADLKGLTS